MFAYLDNAATTPVCLEAAQSATFEMEAGYGHPSARYAFGQNAAKRLQENRTTVARALGCLPEELYFTSCGTEGDNWAIQGAVEYGRRRGRHIITTAIEHSAVLEPLKALEAKGYTVTRLKPDRSGHVSPEDLRAALREDTVLVSMMLVNNELGTLQPVAECARITKAYCPDILFHTDAVQAFLKVPFTPKELGVDLLTISGHKVRAPKGIGAQYIRKGLKLPPLLRGGGQEGAMRPGTEPTADADRPARLAEAAENLHALAELALREGVTLCVEELPRTCPGNCSGEMAQLLAAHPALRSCFDTNHLLRETHEHYLNVIGPKVVTLHVSDYDFVDERHQLPGEGSIGWKAVIAQLEALDYAGPWMYELSLMPSPGRRTGRELTLRDLVDNYKALCAL